MAKTVLLVEIEPGVRKLLRLRFELAGLTVLDAADGLGGLTVFRTHHLSLVAVVSGELSDPFDGLAFLDGLRKLDPDIPVYFFLSQSLPHDILHAGVEVFVKPYGLGGLCNRVVEAVERVGADPVLAGCDE